MNSEKYAGDVHQATVVVAVLVRRGLHDLPSHALSSISLTVTETGTTRNPCLPSWFSVNAASASSLSRSNGNGSTPQESF
jgi:hypothetical protein